VLWAMAASGLLIVLAIGCAARRWT
jgi:hypothetical protein